MLGWTGSGYTSHAVLAFTVRVYAPGERQQLAKDGYQVSGHAGCERSAAGGLDERHHLVLAEADVRNGVEKVLAEGGIRIGPIPSSACTFSVNRDTVRNLRS